MEFNIEKAKKELREILLHPSEQNIKDNSYNYTLFQANIQRFLPKFDTDNFEELYKQFIYYKNITFFDQFDLKKLAQLSVVNHSTFDLSPSNLKEPAIFATFHYGSYKVMNFYLLKQGFKVVLIVDEYAYYKQKEKIKKLYLQYKEDALKNNSDFIILNVKEPSFKFKDSTNH
jgi:KDO2-lipid IV(A) lauroyltransferase